MEPAHAAPYVPTLPYAEIRNDVFHDISGRRIYEKFLIYRKNYEFTEYDRLFIQEGERYRKKYAEPFCSQKNDNTENN